MKWASSDPPIPPAALASGAVNPSTFAAASLLTWRKGWGGRRPHPAERSRNRSLKGGREGRAGVCGRSAGDRGPGAAQHLPPQAMPPAPHACHRPALPALLLREPLLLVTRAPQGPSKSPLRGPQPSPGPDGPQAGASQPALLHLTPSTAQQSPCTPDPSPARPVPLPGSMPPNTPAKPAPPSKPPAQGHPGSVSSTPPARGPPWAVSGSVVPSPVLGGFLGNLGIPPMGLGM